ncbi:MAG: aldose 1-epimerase family protein [Clostridiales bacterium]|nr:aldose 1-epimerase family protein [Clostridiales bacterium]
MDYVISNNKLTVTISSKGGEIMSIKGAGGIEYVWQGNPRFWAGRTPQLFPFVGRLFGGKYTIDGKEYSLGIHGFLRDSEMELESKCGTGICLSLSSNEKNMALYPREWKLLISYTISESTVNISFEVCNRGSKIMYFGYGGHPGFNVPLAEGLRFEDYYLEFGQECSPNAVNLSDTCFVVDGVTPFAVQGSKRIPLKHSLFDRDAIVLCDMSRTVSLKSDKDSRFVRVDYPQMPFLGIWHKPLSQAPYVCIEPWVSLPGRQDMTECFETKGDLVELAAGDTYKNDWSITVG